MRKRGFTLIELLVVITIIAVLASIVFPVFSRAKEAAKKTVCLSNMRQIGLALTMYMTDHDDRLPDRRDLKSSLPGGYRPWTTWPPSDPRAGWAQVVLFPYTRNNQIWMCPTTKAVFDNEVQVEQAGVDGYETDYWMWRFDRATDPVPLDNLWGKTPESSVSDLQDANDPIIGRPEGITDIEILVDPYFPRTIPSTPSHLRGRAVHFGGRNRLFMDCHAKFMKDRRTN